MAIRAVHDESNRCSGLGLLRRPLSLRATLARATKTEYPTASSFMTSLGDACRLPGAGCSRIRIYCRRHPMQMQAAQSPYTPGEAPGGSSASTHRETHRSARCILIASHTGCPSPA